MDWMILPYKRYADFEGRSQRMEYWMFTLFYLIVAAILAAIMIAGIPAQESIGQYDGGGQAEPGVLFWIGLGLLAIFVLGSIIPSIAVGVRRLHDQDKTGWLYLISFVPYVGGLIFLVLMCLDGTHGPNSYGEDPKDPGAQSVFE
uniref:DUF805 domain-containing protein n=1 Tax=Parerythrobacter lutipelagi TaxID=1964208 RepID=UPI0010F527B2|nr:DUF805 domain-containing protein [Parerythrobacter lutipelagi]